MTRRASAGVIALAMAVFTVASACSKDDHSESGQPTTTLPALAGLEQVTTAIDCTKVVEMDELEAPIRGGAATAGVACELPTGSLHLFARAPLGGHGQVGAGMGGRTENIDRVLGTADAPDPTCPAEVVIGTSYFAVSDSPDSLAVLERIAGHVERSATPTAPMTSYLGRPCHTGLSF